MTMQELVQGLNKLHAQWLQGLITDREYAVCAYRWLVSAKLTDEPTIKG